MVKYGKTPIRGRRRRHAVSREVPDRRDVFCVLPLLLPSRLRDLPRPDGDPHRGPSAPHRGRAPSLPLRKRAARRDPYAGGDPRGGYLVRRLERFLGGKDRNGGGYDGICGAPDHGLRLYRRLRLPLPGGNPLVGMLAEAHGRLSRNFAERAGKRFDRGGRDHLLFPLLARLRDLRRRPLLPLRPDLSPRRGRARRHRLPARRQSARR